MRLPVQGKVADVSDEIANSPTLMRAEIVEALLRQGFEVRSGGIVPADSRDKAGLRNLHRLAVAHRIGRAQNGLARHESRLLGLIANGDEVDPRAITPELVEVQPRTVDELLFRYAALHWSIPVSSGYGRRLRFLVRDSANGKLMGIIGLGDPVFALRPRDAWIGWEPTMRRERLHHVMDAFVLGAVGPYASLLCGKLIAQATTTQEVRFAFRRKYGGRTGRISGRAHDGRLALVTTTSALGRSSVYNRLPEAISVGFTRGSGEFHFSNGLYRTMTSYALAHCVPTAKRSEWGSGFRNRRELVKKVLQDIGMSDQWLYHGVRREVFVLPLAQNTNAFLRGEHERLRWHPRTLESVFDSFRTRWLLPRADRDGRYREFQADSWRLWTR